jgi:hypothetical protein
MMNTYSDLTLAAWMSWFQLGIMLVPLLIVMIYLEYRDWRHDHPKQVWKPRMATPQGPWGPGISPFGGMTTP